MRFRKETTGIPLLRHAGAGLLLASVLAGSGTSSIAQVRPLVLDDPSRTTRSAPPPRLPPRRAAFEPMWEIDAGGRVIDGLIGGPGGIIYATREGVVRMLAPRDGRLVWERPLEAGPEAPPAGIGGRLFIAAARSLYALAADNGERLWTVPLPSSPAAAPACDGHLVVIPLASGELWTYDPATGAPRWTTPLDCSPATPAGLGNGRIAVGCREGEVVTLDRDTGQVTWRRSTGSAVATIPWIGEKSIYLANDARGLVALGLRKGRPRYRARLGARPGPFLLARGRLVLVGALDNLLYAFRAKGGHLAWSADLGSRPVSPPAVRGDLAVSAPVLATQLVAVDVRDGALLATEPLPGEDRHSASGPIFAGPILVVATRPAAGGAGWLTGYAVQVEELPQPLIPYVGRSTSR